MKCFLTGFDGKMIIRVVNNWQQRPIEPKNDGVELW